MQIFYFYCYFKTCNIGNLNPCKAKNALYIYYLFSLLLLTI